MGMKDWLNKLQKDAKDKLNQESDPAAQKQKKKEDAAKNVKRAGDIMKLAKKGMDAYGKAAKKIDEITHDATEKTVELAEKLKPVADKVDEATDKLADKAKGAFDVVKDKIAKNGSGNETPKPEKPTTGSGLLDILTPAVPETDATKPRPKKPDTPPAAP